MRIRARGRTPRRRLLRWGVPAAVVVLAIAGAAAFDDVWREKSMAERGKVVSTVDAAQLDTVDRTRVFFGHQSVGENILGGVVDVYARRGAPAPSIELDGSTPGPRGGFISHSFLGENEKPLGKIADFDRALRGGVGDVVDVAMMKLCFLDITTGTDVAALFGAYRDTIAALEKDYPDIEFVHVTVPLTTDLGLTNRVKIALGGSDRYGRGENVARESYNALLRDEYAADRIFDLAAIESTTPDGERRRLHYRDQPYYALHTGYASDLAHLNDEGSEIAATAWLQAVASASPR